jgi:hypothetical protein
VCFANFNRNFHFFFLQLLLRPLVPLQLGNMHDDGFTDMFLSEWIHPDVVRRLTPAPTPAQTPSTRSKTLPHSSANNSTDFIFYTNTNSSINCSANARTNSIPYTHISTSSTRSQYLL